MIVYALIDPFTEECRYIGQTIRPVNERLLHHLSPSHLKRINYKNNWIRGLKNKGTRPIVVVLERAENRSDLDEKEQFWISYFKFLGIRLVNSTDGGHGVRGLLIKKRPPMSEETKRKIGLANSGNKNNLGKKWSKESVLKKVLNNPNRNPVVNQFGIIYESAADAGRKCGIPSTNIVQIMNGKRKSYKGFVFTRIGEKTNESCK